MAAGLDSPIISGIPNLSYTDLYPVYGPTFSLVEVEHSDELEVQISPFPGDSPSVPIRVGIFASVFPSWYYGSLAAQFEVCWIVCIDNSCWDFFSKLDLPVPVYRLPCANALPNVHVVAFNDRCSKHLFMGIVSTLPPSTLIITDFKLRHLPPSLSHCHIALEHKLTGGVSDGVGRFTFACSSGQLISSIRDVPFPSYPHAGLSSILDRTIRGRKTGFIPKSAVLSPSQVLPVINQRSTFYAHGLYPLGCSYTPKFIAPCVFPTTPWTIRSLRSSELAHVFDIPPAVVSSLGQASLTALLHRLRYPLKLHSVLLQHLFYYRWPSLCAPLAPSAINDDVTLPSIGVPSDPSSSAPLGQASRNVLDPGGGTIPIVVDNSSHPVTDEERKAVAVKSDDAPVPVHVWRKQLERILDIPIDEQPYEAGADKFRGKLLCMWRRGLLRDFICWAKKEHPSLAKEYSWCTGQFDWPCKGNRKSLGDTTGGGIVHWNRHKKAYVWFRKGTKFANVGRKRYKDTWVSKRKLMEKSRIAFKECMEKAVGCTWWRWDSGSRLFFWRWPKEFMEEARDGCKCWFEKELLPNYRVPQSPPSNPEMKDKIREKLADVLQKLYMSTEGEIKSLTSFFDVMKGLFDIRMVYNGTSCGLNAACWAPWFPLPTVRTHLRTVEQGTWLADIDLGEMFLNFLLDLRLQAYAGVDLTLYFPEMLSETKTTFWARWTRLLMGFCASPYFATRCLLRARRVILGEKANTRNPFHWSHAVKNYPGFPSYNPLRPRVYKIRDDGKIASDLHKYIDDLRVTSFDEASIWSASMQIMTKVNWLGMQNAARKYREGSLKQGAWAGAIVFTPSEVTVSISQARWDKCKEIIAGMILIAEENDQVFTMTKLLSDRGFLVYVSQTYTAMAPYLKGMHLTVDSWRPGRDHDGWKMKIESRIRGVYGHRPEKDGEKVDEDVEEEVKKVGQVVEEEVTSKLLADGDGKPTGDLAPTEVKGVPRLNDDLVALGKMFADDAPIERRVRAASADMVKFGFGDASGDGYGSGLAKLKGRPNIRHGKWGLFYSSEHTSSNFRELRNIVDAIEVDYRRGLLDGFELFFFTDNEVAEKAYYKGTSSSRTLFELVLRLRLIEMEGRMVIHVIHISGKRMIACGIDGLSRGDTGDGIAAGVHMESFVPLHLDAVERSPGVVNWINSWWPQEEIGSLSVLGIDDWFIQDEGKENCLWLPAPAGAESSVEELANWIHYNPDSRVHLFLIPTVWTCTWRKQLGKICDVCMTLPNVFEFWNLESHYEPLTLGIFVPYLNRGSLGGLKITSSWRSWQGRCGRCKKTLRDPIAELFCANFCSRRGRFDACFSAWCPSCYCEIGSTKFPRAVPLDDEGMELPGLDALFRTARAGDTLMTPFQCDLCHFRNVKGRNPYVENDRDQLALTMIRRANLDAFWARTSATVQSNMADFRQQVKHSLRLWGSTPSLPARGPFPLRDDFGMGVATITLSRSLDKGKNSPNIQFNTARRIRSSFSNYWNASIMTLETGVMQDGQSKMMLTECPVYHFWFTRMMAGMHERMGDNVIQDQAVSRELQEAMMEVIEKRLTSDTSNYDRWVEVGAFGMMLWLGALRGNEAMMASLDGCARMMEESESAQKEDDGFGVLVLQGKFKSSTGRTRYLLYLSSQTRSKFTTPFRGWLSRLLKVRQRQGRNTGWMFAKEDGTPLEMSHFELDLLRVIAEVQSNTEGIIPKDLDVFDRYGVFRSWRRGATSVIRNEGLISKEDIKLNNWWRKIEDSRGKHVAGDMLAYYTEDLLVIDAKKRFSAAL